MPKALTIFVAMMLATLGVSDAAMAQSGVKVITVTEDANGKTIEVANGQGVAVRLPVQAGTGFGWEVLRSSGIPTKLVQSKVERGQSRPNGGIPVLGGSETQVLLFKPVGAGNAEIELVYRRPWMKQEPPAKTFSLHLAVH